MSIDLSQLHPVFRPSTVTQKKEEDRLKTWKAIFYTVRNMAWKNACKQLRREGIDTGLLVYNRDGEVETTEGLTLLQYFDEHREEFNDSFDRAFIKATIDELVGFSKEHFGKGFDELMKDNDQRMADYRNRPATQPIIAQPIREPIRKPFDRDSKPKLKPKGDRVDITEEEINNFPKGDIEFQDDEVDVTEEEINNFSKDDIIDDVEM